MCNKTRINKKGRIGHTKHNSKTTYELVKKKVRFTYCNYLLNRRREQISWQVFLEPFMLLHIFYGCSLHGVHLQRHAQQADNTLVQVLRNREYARFDFSEQCGDMFIVKG